MMAVLGGPAEGLPLGVPPAPRAGGAANSSMSAEFRKRLQSQGSAENAGDNHISGDSGVRTVAAVEHCLRALEEASNRQPLRQRAILDVAVFRSHPSTLLTPALMDAIAKAAVGEGASMPAHIAGILLAVTASQVPARRLRVCGFGIGVARPRV
jgi:hypothetical protein